MTMRYLWEICPTNRNFAELHVDRKLPELRAGDSLFSYSREPIPTEFKPFVDGVLAIPGVESVSTRSHVIGVIKGTVFRWDEIMPGVEVLARDTFDPDGEIDKVRDGSDYGIVLSAVIAGVAGDPDED
jgi:hypothetical protein